MLHKDGAMEMSYDQRAKDAIVGIYPLLYAEAEKPLATLSAPRHNTGRLPLDEVVDSWPPSAFPACVELSADKACIVSPALGL